MVERLHARENSYSHLLTVKDHRVPILRNIHRLKLVTIFGDSISALSAIHRIVYVC